MTIARETGRRQPWWELFLGQYVRGELPREQAAEQIGIDRVELAERQRDAMTEDLAWALEG